jgi:hypothetical protein
MCLAEPLFPFLQGPGLPPVGRLAFTLFNKMEVIENTPVFFAEHPQIFGGSESRRFLLS